MELSQFLPSLIPVGLHDTDLMTSSFHDIYVSSVHFAIGNMSKAITLCHSQSFNGALCVSAKIFTFNNIFGKRIAYNPSECCFLLREVV